jgi:hypothetical protein
MCKKLLASQKEVCPMDMSVRHLKIVRRSDGGKPQKHPSIFPVSVPELRPANQQLNLSVKKKIILGNSVTTHSVC